MLQHFLPYVSFVRCVCIVLAFSFAFLAAPSESIARKNNKKLSKKTAPRLIAGDVHAQLPLQKRDRSYARGRFVFAEIKIFNKGRRRYRNAQLVFETKDPIIHSIVNLDDGRNIIRGYSRRRKRHVVSIRRLSRTKPQIYWVELKLGKPEVSDSKADTRTYLNITLGSRNGEGNWDTDTTHMSWKLSNCGASYHKALSGGSNSEIHKLNHALTELSHKDKDMPGRWIFSPVKSYKTETIYRDVCTRYKYYRNRQTGKRYKKCRVSRKVKKTIKTLIKAPKEVQEVLNLSGGIVAARGSDQSMRLHTDGYWVVRKIYEDIKRYLEQRANPAICTGTLQMTEFYEAKFEPVTKKNDELKNNLKAALELAKLKAGAYLKLTGSNRHARLFQVRSRDILARSEDEENTQKNLSVMEGILIKFASLSPDKQFITDFKNTDSILAKLKIFKNVIAKYSNELELNEEAKKRLRETLTMIEAAYYLQVLSSRYEKIKVIVSNSIRDIRSTYSKHCNCAD
ncbi:MAG: hypothetical protein ACRBBN_08430 [Methyloligellaceae bacterium]